MKPKLEWLGKTRTHWIISAFLIAGYVVYRFQGHSIWTTTGLPKPFALAGMFAAIFGIALLLKQPWARWVGLAMLIAAIASFPMITRGAWTIGQIIGIIALLAAGYSLWRVDEDDVDEHEEEERELRSSDQDHSAPLVSLIFLLREPRYLDASILATLASRAWDYPISSGDESGSKPMNSNEEAFIVGDSPTFIAKHPDAMLIIHNFAAPYFSEIEQATAGIVDLRCRNAVETHRAWMSVDLLESFTDDELWTNGYRLIGRLLAELADNDVLAVFNPESGRILVYDSETEAKLRSSNPLAALDDSNVEPIVDVDPDDPKMRAAVSEARSRWSEFVGHFEQRGADSAAFIVKAPFGKEPDREFMWMEVSAIENDRVYGILKNEPMNVPGLRVEDRVCVPVSDVNDWLSVVNGEAIGGFTLKIIADQANGET